MSNMRMTSREAMYYQKGFQEGYSEAFTAFQKIIEDAANSRPIVIHVDNPGLIIQPQGGDGEE
jgi:hypothetical protein